MEGISEQDDVIMEESNLQVLSSFGLSESILMDFVETVVETNISEYLLQALHEFFHGNKLEKTAVTDIINLMKNTFVRFFGKTMYFRSLTQEDQIYLTTKNSNLLIHFCLAQYEAASTGFDQFSWLLATNIPPISKYILRFFKATVFNSLIIDVYLTNFPTFVLIS